MLNRNITTISGIAIAVSMVIGSGLFALPGLTIESTDPVSAILGWSSVIFLMPPMIYIFSFLGRKFPLSGGVSLYAAHAFGQWSKGGFSLVICGALAVGMPAFFMVGGAYLSELLNLDPSSWTIPLAIVLSILSTAMNAAGINKVGWINQFIVITVLALVFMLIFFSVPVYQDGGDAAISEAVSNYSLDISAVWLAATIVFWAFQGWENLSFGLEEFKNPDRSIPVVFWASFFFISITYFSFAVAATMFDLTGQSVQGLSGLTVMMGDGFIRTIILALTVLVLIANANSWVFGASRAFYSAAQQGVMPNKLSKLNNKKLPLISLLSTLILYICVMVIMWFFDIHAKYAFLLTTQGFIILYGASILAFTKLTSGFFARIIALVALGSWIFLMHGFGWLILYPIALFMVGITLDFKFAKSAAEVTGEH